MLAKERKAEIINKFAKSVNDTGSSEVQIALLTERIEQISNHLKSFPKDTHCKIGLVRLVGRRRRLTKYLKENDRLGFEKVSELLKRK